MLFDTTTEAATAKFDGAYRGRRLSWAELYKLRPDLKPANDNSQPDETIATRRGGVILQAA